MDPIKARTVATVRQLEYLEAVEKHGSNRAAARALGVAESAIRASLRALGRKVSMADSAPDAEGPDSVPTSSSTLYGADGKAKLQWVKVDHRRSNTEGALREFIMGLCEHIKGLALPTEEPTFCVDDLLAVYPLGDPHYGALVDSDETGLGSWDLSIAANRHEAAMQHLASITPPASHALLINLGDAIHMDDSTNRTPASKAVLDADSRYGKVLSTAATSLIRCVHMLLAKHRHVTVWSILGNHDPHSGLALSLALQFYFHNEPRVTVDTGTGLYKYMQFGSVLLGAHHGHGAKAPDLPLIMANDRPQEWGDTRHRVWHCGHVHHKTVKDYVGCTVETHRTLVPPDAWHAGAGYRSKQDASVVVYHREAGEIQRSRYDPDFMEKAARTAQVRPDPAPLG